MHNTNLTTINTSTKKVSMLKTLCHKLSTYSSVNNFKMKISIELKTELANVNDSGQ